LLDEKLAEQAQMLGNRLSEGLRAIRHPAIREIRGKGLLIGLELDPAWIAARKFCEELMRNGILSKETHETVVRFAPPLIITADEIDSALVIIRSVFDLLDHPQLRGHDHD
ncbi:MAG: aminotransferase class III-fold pyridoxal phosphate-dependent enzyme, partial [Burkholderiaceae bacterium]